MPRLLLIEDDARIRSSVQKTVGLDASCLLEFVTRAGDAIPAAIKIKPDLILLDIRLPDGDGRVLLKRLKQNQATAAIPVILLTGLDSESDKVLGLNLGADDYIAKPFGAMELMARIQAVLRRYQKPSAQKPRISGLSLDAENRKATLDGKTLALQPKEFEILYLLVSREGQTLTRSFLIENSSSYGLPVSTRSLDTHIKNIRKKLGPKARWIRTVSKMGYQFRIDD
ncbi:MAG TPA: response regulator transcription factor [Elusimicrobiota bacterium]|nr:response regulator transcription factor [Elusimicrobiota bacterium]